MTDTIRTQTDYGGFITLTPEPWMADSSCGTSGNPDAWFPEGKGRAALAAIRICNGCEVREQCLRFALDNNETEGVWGGLAQHAIRKLRRSTS